MSRLRIEMKVSQRAENEEGATQALEIGCYNAQKVVSGKIDGAFELSDPTSGDMASRGGSGCGEKLIALDFRGDADMAVGIRFDAHDLAATTDIDFGALRDLFGKGEHKFDLGADFELRFGEEVESLVADVARLGAEFAAARFAREHP
jgi:hypothetical protein